MAKINITNLTEGYLVINSIQINNNKLSIPPKATAVVEAEYKDDSHVLELSRMKKVKVSDYSPEAQKKAAQGKSGKNGKATGKEEISNQDGREVTFATAKGSPKKGSMVSSILDKKTDTPLIDGEPEDADDKLSDAFVPI